MKQRRFGNGCCCVKGWELPASSICIVLWFVGKFKVQMLPRMSHAGASGGCVHLGGRWEASRPLSSLWGCQSHSRQITSIGRK